jgi:hypothetical protein
MAALFPYNHNTYNVEGNVYVCLTVLVRALIVRGSQTSTRTRLHCILRRTPILENWSEDNFEEHQPVAKFPQPQPVEGDEGLQGAGGVGHSAGAAAAAAANAAERKLHNKTDLEDSGTT